VIAAAGRALTCSEGSIKRLECIAPQLRRPRAQSATPHRAAKMERCRPGFHLFGRPHKKCRGEGCIRCDFGKLQKRLSQCARCKTLAAGSPDDPVLREAVAGCKDCSAAMCVCRNSYLCRYKGESGPALARRALAAPLSSR
jgi:hypothetical protein